MLTETAGKLIEAFAAHGVVFIDGDKIGGRPASRDSRRTKRLAAMLGRVADAMYDAIREAGVYIRKLR